MRLDRPGLRPVAAALAGVAVQAALVVPVADWQDELPTVAVAAGILVAVLAGAVGGLWAGLAVAAAGWTLQLAFVVDDTAEALVALPAWLAAAAAAGWIAERLRRQTAERALAQNELRGVRSSAAEAILRLDAEGTIVAWSAGAEELYGYAAEEAEGRPVGDLFAEDGAVERVLEALARGEAVAREEARQRRRDGSAFRALVSMVALDAVDGGPRGAVAVAADADDALRLRDRLGDTEATLRSLREHLPLVTYVHPPGDRFAPALVSGQIDRLLGYEPDEWVADPGLFGRLLHPDDRERVLEEVAALPDATTPLRCEYRLVARDGRTVWVQDEAVLVLDAAGEPLCAQGFLLDVTERRTADEDRRLLRAAEADASADARDRQRRLDAVGRAAGILVSSLDYRLTIRELAAVAVRDLCDWCVADVLEEDGELVRVAAEHADPAPALPTPGPSAEPEVEEVVRSQELELAESRICVPLLSRGRRSLGALTFLAAEHGRRFTADDLPWAQALAAVAAVAVDNARLYEEAESRADATRVLTYVGDGVFMLDRSGVVRLWNPAAEVITGLPGSAVLGRAAAEAIPGWPEVAERTPVAAAKEPARAEALPLETERGERWISISAVEFFGGTVYAFRDITDAHRLDELQADFIATASHELRTPLAA
ncbi:MAG TPA: PAS domain S-box protein, partial [Gaiellaceae bacterium]|nr:PAS domain S-box protein [Gaiellaceae bacterium]